MYVVLLLNAAFAGINIKTQDKYTLAVEYCTRALAVDNVNVKGLYRRGLALKELAEMIER